MFNKNDILTRLQNGESADAIAAEFAKNLNAAEAEMKMAAAMNQKRKDFKISVNYMLDFCKKYYGDNPMFQEVVKLEDADYDKMLAEIEGYFKIGEAFGRMAQAVEKETPTADDILRSWINKI